LYDRFIDIVNLFNKYIAAAFVLINCELDSEKDIVQQLKSIGNVKYVYGTFGAYDIVVKLESEHAEKIRETITREIRRIDKIRSTLTLMVIED
jgi:DNA-binding Lrp family transcriptional regulator